MGRKSKIQIEKEQKEEKYRLDSKKMKEIADLINYQIFFIKEITIERYLDGDEYSFGQYYDSEEEIPKTMIEIIFETGFIEHLSTYCLNYLEHNSNNLSIEDKNNIENIFNQILDKKALDNPVDYIYNILF